MDSYIWIQNKKYHYYGTYTTWKEAINTAKRYRKRNKCRYFIIKTETQGFLDIIPETKYRLYLNKVYRLW